MMDFREEIFYEFTTNYGVTFQDPCLYGFEKSLDILVTDPLLKRYEINTHEPSTAPYLSNKFYGTKDFWWLILYINGEDNPYHLFPIHSIVYYPPESSISKYKSSLKKLSLNTNMTDSKGYIGGSFSF